MIGWMFSRTAESFSFPVLLTEEECVRKGKAKFLERSFYVARGVLYVPEISLENVKELLESINEQIWLKTGVDEGLKFKKKKLEALTSTLNGAFQTWLEDNEKKRLSYFWQMDEAKRIGDI